MILTPSTVDQQEIDNATPTGATVLLTCETIFGIERGKRIVELVETTTGQPCPCKQGRECPMMPRD